MYIWLISNHYTESLSKYISLIDAKDENTMGELGHRFEYVWVDSEGDVAAKNGVYLGLQFYLPIHYVVKNIINKAEISALEKISADVLETSDYLIKEYSLDTIFPRLVSTDAELKSMNASLVLEDSQGRNYDDAQKLYTSICNHFGTDIDIYKIKMGGTSQDDSENTECIRCSKENRILFDTHFSNNHGDNGGITKTQLKSKYNSYLYIDSISGANYTSTLKHLFANSISPDIVSADGMFPQKKWSDKILSLKIKESAITRITVIDERIFEGIRKWIDLDSNDEYLGDFSGSQVEMSLKNIRVLNWFEDSEEANPLYKKVEGFSILRGNEFRPVGPYKEQPNKTDFLSIHLGIIEKILKDSNEAEKIYGDKSSNPFSEDRIKKLFEHINTTFSPNFICIHSGRGGLSKELEDTVLRQYPFLPFVTLEHLFNDSKFLLSQMFYSLKYNKN